MLYIIVPVFNRSNDTRKFLESILQQTFKDVFIIIVNDGSKDDTSEVLYSFKQNLHLKEIKSDSLWWGGSINAGLNWLFDEELLNEDDYLAFANNDIMFDSLFIENVIKYIYRLGENYLIHPQVQDSDGRFMSAGAKIVSWFPFITKHPKNISNEYAVVDLGTARFLCGHSSIFKKLKGISNKLPQYQGDNDFTLRAKKNGIKTLIVRDVVVTLDDTHTGKKSYNINSFSELVDSFKNIKSPNNLRYRLVFLRNHFNAILAFFILIGMSLNTTLKFIKQKII